MSTAAHHHHWHPRLAAIAAALICSAGVVVTPAVALSPSAVPAAARVSAMPLTASPVWTPRGWARGREVSNSRLLFQFGLTGGSWSLMLYSVARLDFATTRTGSKVTYPKVGRPFYLHATVGVVFPDDSPDTFALSITLPAGVRRAIAPSRPLRCYVTTLAAVPVRRVAASQCSQRPATSARTVRFTAQRLTEGQAVHFFLPVVSSVVMRGATDRTAAARLTAVLRQKMALPSTLVATNSLRVTRTR